MNRAIRSLEHLGIRYNLPVTIDVINRVITVGPYRYNGISFCLEEAMERAYEFILEKIIEDIIIARIKT